MGSVCIQVCAAVGGINLLAWAFPAVQYLTLGDVKLEEDAIRALSTISTLTYLRLVNATMDSGAVPAAAVALAQLPNLQTLLLEGSDTPILLASQLTGLTSLTDRTATSRDS
jgi:hypothetical protein